MQLTNRLEQAIRVAAKAHREQTRKGTGVPYITHPFSVMCIAQTVTNDEDTLIACLFHDILEDVPDKYPEQQMRLEFGDNVVSIVKAVTKNDQIDDWHERCKAYLQQLSEVKSKNAIIVACADKIHNLMTTLADYEVQGDEIWKIFSTGKEAQLWWYESVRELIAKRSPQLPLLAQLDNLIAQLQQVVLDE